VPTLVPKILGGVAFFTGVATGNLDVAAVGSAVVAGSIGVDWGDKTRETREENKARKDK